MNQLKQLHAFTLRTGEDHTEVLILKILEIREIGYAHKLFDLIPEPTLFLYNRLIQAYSVHGPHRQCFSLYAQMCRRRYSPNPILFTFLFPACASLSLFDQVAPAMIHARFIMSGCEADLYASTALVDMYAKLGLVESARKQFDQIHLKDVPTWNSMVAGYARCGDMNAAVELFWLMPSRNVVSWTAMVSGYSQNGNHVDALRMFLLMEKETDLVPNEVTIASVLPACANLGALEIGQRIEIIARRNGYLENVFVSNALLEMYAKCGRLDVATSLFYGLGNRRNLCSWNSMIMGFAIHGGYEEALRLFQDMQERNKPDEITFVGALMACTHGGLVAKGRELFESMERDFNVTPKVEHYGCMVDLLGRAGKLEEAYELIQNIMPMKPDSVIWGTLLGACSFHKNVGVAEKAAARLFELEPWNPGNYVILSNIYASAESWYGVAKVRTLMKDCKIVKTAGHSFFEEGGQIHKFIVEDKSHPRSDEIYALLADLFVKMRSNVKEMELTVS
ncbi:hypothetical protein Dimus_006671 [Dionaea muscipula]